MDELINDKMKKRHEYYTSYYQKNRERLLQYQHQYNQTHFTLKPSKYKVGKRFGKLAVTRMNIQKRLNNIALRVSEFKKQLELEKQITNTGLRAKDTEEIFLPL